MNGEERVNSVATSVESGVAIRINTRRRIRLIYGTVFSVVCIRVNGSGRVSESARSVDGMTRILTDFMPNGLGILVQFASQ